MNKKTSTDALTIALCILILAIVVLGVLLVFPDMKIVVPNDPAADINWNSCDIVTDAKYPESGCQQNNDSNAFLTVGDHQCQMAVSIDMTMQSVMCDTPNNVQVYDRLRDEGSEVFTFTNPSCKMHFNGEVWQYNCQDQ